jgi:HPt (histidine-containing phosphotransfer) domain-containing protein
MRNYWPSRKQGRRTGINTGFPGKGLDRDLALSRVGEDAELLKEIAALFIEDYPNVMAEIRAAAARGDANGVERAAHGLKGSVANFGAQAAVDAAFQLEQMGRAGDLSRVSEAIDALARSLDALRPELQAL